MHRRSRLRRQARIGRSVTERSKIRGGPTRHGLTAPWCQRKRAGQGMGRSKRPCSEGCSRRVRGSLCTEKLSGSCLGSPWRTSGRIGVLLPERRGAGPTERLCVVAAWLHADANDRSCAPEAWCSKAERPSLFRRSAKNEATENCALLLSSLGLWFLVIKRLMCRFTMSTSVSRT